MSSYRRHRSLLASFVLLFKVQWSPFLSLTPTLKNYPVWFYADPLQLPSTHLSDPACLPPQIRGFRLDIPVTSLNSERPSELAKSFN